jgi:hypothetical protein
MTDLNPDEMLDRIKRSLSETEPSFLRHPGLASEKWRVPREQ